MLRLLDRANTMLLSLLGLGLIGMVALSVYNVISRYVFNAALLWADEVAVFSMIALAFLGAIVSTWRDSHIRMDILSNLLPANMQWLLQIVQQLVIAGLCGWVTTLSLSYITRTYAIGMRSDASGLPVWLVHSVIPFSLCVIALISLLRCIRLIAGLGASFTPKPDQKDAAP